MSIRLSPRSGDGLRPRRIRRRASVRVRFPDDTPVRLLPDEFILEARVRREVHGDRPNRICRRRQRQRCGGIPGTQLGDASDEEDVLSKCSCRRFSETNSNSRRAGTGARASARAAPSPKLTRMDRNGTPRRDCCSELARGHSESCAGTRAPGALSADHIAVRAIREGRSEGGSPRRIHIIDRHETCGTSAKGNLLRLRRDPVRNGGRPNLVPEAHHARNRDEAVLAEPTTRSAGGGASACAAVGRAVVGRTERIRRQDRRRAVRVRERENGGRNVGVARRVYVEGVAVPLSVVIRDEDVRLGSRNPAHAIQVLQA